MIVGWQVPPRHLPAVLGEFVKHYVAGNTHGLPELFGDIRADVYPELWASWCRPGVQWLRQPATGSAILADQAMPPR
jgi:hypothetical protein